MIVELRHMGRKELALYTNDNWVYQRFSKWKCTIGKVPYTQNDKLVGVDLYFDRKARSTIHQVLNGQLMLNI